jgi:hypothetical protein
MDATHLFTATLATVIELSFFTTTHLPSSIRSAMLLCWVTKTRCQAKMLEPLHDKSCKLKNIDKNIKG